jgi:hypothetical protein
MKHSILKWLLVISSTYSRGNNWKKSILALAMIFLLLLVLLWHCGRLASSLACKTSVAAASALTRSTWLARGGSLSKSFQYGPPGGPSITSRQWWVWVRFCVREIFFYSFMYAESTVSTFNNRIELKVYIHECIFWGCSVDHFREDNLAIFDHKIYP